MKRALLVALLVFTSLSLGTAGAAASEPPSLADQQFLASLAQSTPTPEQPASPADFAMTPRARPVDHCPSIPRCANLACECGHTCATCGGVKTLPCPSGACTCNLPGCT
ncbi:MAG: hypothetical protein QOH06_1830 [Acidobacteriota bacterium]|jgi:hypothetical protein|nr:hypothetical protein [Acidobacteriota bacterium]